MRSFLKSDYAVHEMIWRMADNEFLEAALRRVVLPLFGFTAIRLSSRDTFDLLRDAQSHLPTIQAIKAKHPEEARAALRDALRSWSAQTKEYVLGNNSDGQAAHSLPIATGPPSVADD